MDAGVKGFNQGLNVGIALDGLDGGLLTFALYSRLGLRRGGVSGLPHAEGELDRRLVIGLQGLLQAFLQFLGVKVGLGGVEYKVYRVGSPLF